MRKLIPGILLILCARDGRAQLAREPSPLRQGVDIYNQVGSSARLVAFMKIGASAHDTTYLGFLNAELANQPLPRAYLEGTSIYFRGLDEPLRALDLRHRLFSLHGRRIDLNLPRGIAAALMDLREALRTRPRYSIFFDWLLPMAVANALSERGAPVQLAGLLAVGGVTANLDCLGKGDANCARIPFLRELTDLGAVGSFAPSAPVPKQVFCTPDATGASSFVVYGSSRAVLKVSAGELGLPNANPSRASEAAAGELLSACGSASTLAALNTAFAYPSTAASVAQAESSFSDVTRGPASVARPTAISGSGVGAAR